MRKMSEGEEMEREGGQKGKERKRDDRGERERN